MALKLNIKPGEKLFIPGGTIEIAASGTIAIALNGNIAIIREGDYLSQGQTHTPARQMCFALQSVYLSVDGASKIHSYADALRKFKPASEESSDLLSELNGHVYEGDIFRALKVCRKIVQLEEGAADWQALVAR